MRTTWSFSSAGEIVFGSGAAEQLGDVARRLGMERILVVTDEQLVGAGVAKQVEGPLAEQASLEFFAGGEPEPSLDAAGRCVAHASAFKPDGLVGLGGGSNMDLAKIAAAVLSHGGSPRDYLGVDKVPGPVVPLICVPTTAGTGSEVSGAGVFTDRENNIKVGAMSNYLRPTVAVVDPKLTVTCPRKVTADSGIDAMTHAIEAFTAVDFAEFPAKAAEASVYQGRYPLTDCLAEKAIAIIGANLERAVEQPDNLEAREAMALGAMLAGLAFSNAGVALVHALEYPLGGVTHCTHGAGNGLLLPHVMRYNLPVRRQAFAHIARLLGEDTSGLGEQEAAERSITRIEQLNRAIGIPTRIRDLGATKEQLPEMAEKALAIGRIVRVNPRAPKLPEVIELLNEAY